MSLKFRTLIISIVYDDQQIADPQEWALMMLNHSPNAGAHYKVSAANTPHDEPLDIHHSFKFDTVPVATTVKGPPPVEPYNPFPRNLQ